MTEDRVPSMNGPEYTSTTLEAKVTMVNQMLARQALARFGRVGRDPRRIEMMLMLLRERWEKNPDMRFGQLIGNVFRNERPGTGIEQTGLMNIEDDEFQKALTKWH